jgi:hypothetical protein
MAIDRTCRFSFGQTFDKQTIEVKARPRTSTDAGNRKVQLKHAKLHKTQRTIASIPSKTKDFEIPSETHLLHRHKAIGDVHNSSQNANIADQLKTNSRNGSPTVPNLDIKKLGATSTYLSPTNHFTTQQSIHEPFIAHTKA